MEQKIENRNRFNKIIKKEVIIPSKEELEKNSIEEKSWCKKEGKFIYDPKRKKHCPYCGGRLR